MTRKYKMYFITNFKTPKESYTLFRYSGHYFVIEQFDIELLDCSISYIEKDNNSNDFLLSSLDIKVIDTYAFFTPYKQAGKIKNRCYWCYMVAKDELGLMEFIGGIQ